MSVDLKRQASDLYKQRDDVKNIRTSETLSVNRIMYASLAIVVLALIVLQMFGGFSRRTDPIKAAMTPPTVVKEAPPPELLQEPVAQSAPAEPARPQPAESSSQAPVPARSAEPAATKPVPVQPPAPTPPPPAAKTRPEPVAPPAAATDQASARQAGPRLVRERQTAQVAAGKPVKRETAESAKTPAAPPQPVVSELEQTRRQLARDIVLESNPALLALLVGPENKGWQADQVNTDEYNVVFNIVDKATGTPVQYIWRVNLSTRTSTPLSYYARKLS
jgi:hypothetical protein